MTESLIAWYYAPISTNTSIHLISTSTTITRKMMIITKIARIPLKVPMMLAQPADGSLSPCVAITDIDGISDDVIGLVESEVTKTPANLRTMIN